MCPLIVKLDIKNCRSSAWGCMFFSCYELYPRAVIWTNAVKPTYKLL